MFCGLISRLYVINLPSRADRRREMAAEFGRIGKSFDDPDVTLFPAIRPDDAGGFPSVGAHGCFLSHPGVFDDALRRGEGPILLIEDDATLSTQFLPQARAAFEALAGVDWSLFYGGYESLPVAAGKGLVEVPGAAPIRAAHFLCFNRPVIAPVKGYLEAMLARPPGDGAGGPMHVDGAYCWFRRDHPECRTFAIAPPLAVQRSSRSDIAAQRWYDRTPLISAVAGLARRLTRR